MTNGLRLKGLMLCACVMVLTAWQPAVAGPEGNPRKGKYLYRKNCLHCHAYGSKNQLGPDSKTQKEWEEAFQPSALPDRVCAKEWSTLSEKDILDIYTHMHDHASDSPKPAACR